MCQRSKKNYQKGTSNKVSFFKFVFNVWKNKIMPTLSEIHDVRWLEFDSEEMVKAMLLRPAASK